ncbi:MAG: hypothetical protein JWM80_4279 [Cyanobacteria bacterium RYN_339]|nr:hypothetical protein [Cyanobacteria bacterium RYN_339]
MIVGYASLSEVIPYLSDRTSGGLNETRIVFGNEPFLYRKGPGNPARTRLSQEISDYWLDEGISIVLSSDILRVREFIAREVVQVRLAPRKRIIHAKIYASSIGASIGSSNFTPKGLEAQSEANVRFQSDELRFHETWDTAEGLWNSAEPYRDDLLALLDLLLQPVT